MNHPLPLTPVQILWVNMVTTITLSYALGFEKASADTMKRPPRDVNEGILTKYSILESSMCRYSLWYQVTSWRYNLRAKPYSKRSSYKVSS